MRRLAEDGVVIVGAGIVGVSAAYELTKRGVTDVVVIDRGDLFRTGGSTSHAPGGVFQNNSVRTVSKLAQWSVETFLDANKDGKISADEFKTPRLAAFNRIDANKDGTVTAAELRASQRK